ncbi:MAG: hypothetical protein JXB08_03215 [Bacilli bacterium]|nr:hypothetical protein [Bacilli bacterium]MBN2876299.1 hypothetical protein [Bacilli bacterium]
MVGVLETATSLVNTNAVTTTTTASPTTTTTTASGTQQTLPVFTLTELSQYTGANGSTAYIAVNGVIYDVTSVFTNGTHQGLQLGGTDATAAFASSPHSMSLLNTLPVVGTLEGYAPITVDTTTTTTTTQSSTSHYDDDDHDDDDDDEYDD